MFGYNQPCDSALTHIYICLHMMYWHDIYNISRYLFSYDGVSVME